MTKRRIILFFKSYRRAYTVLTVLVVSALMFVSVESVEAEEGMANATQNYGFYCAPCHGLKGLGDGINATKSQPVQPRNHTSVREMSRLSDEDITDVIKGGGKSVGKSTMMPPFGNTLTDVEIEELLSYLRALCKCSGR